MNGWIAVTDKLPDVEGTYLAWQTGVEWDKDPDKGGKIIRRWGGMWTAANFDGRSFDPVFTHWQLGPGPPTEKALREQYSESVQK